MVSIFLLPSLFHFLSPTHFLILCGVIDVGTIATSHFSCWDWLPIGNRYHCRSSSCVVDDWVKNWTFLLTLYTPVYWEQSSTVPIHLTTLLRASCRSNWTMKAHWSLTHTSDQLQSVSDHLFILKHHCNFLLNVLYSL